MGSDLKTNASKIKTLRMERGWERDQLARIADISPAALQELESDGTASLETIRAVASAFGLGVPELLHELTDGHKSQQPRRDLVAGLVGRRVQDLISSIVPPYLPIIKSAVAASAFALLAAFAIRLSPILIERDQQSELVEYFETSQPLYSSGVAVIEAELGTDVLGDFGTSAREFQYAEGDLEPARGRAPSGVLSGPQSPLTDAVAAPEYGRGMDPVTALETRIEYWPLAESAVAFKSVDLVNMKSSQRDQLSATPSGPLALPSPRGAGQPGGRNFVEYVAHGAAGGYSSMSRSFVRSGKSTAAFFSKVGSSIKKAF